MFTSAAKYGLLIGLIGIGIIMIQYLSNSIIEQGIFQYISPVIYIGLLFYFGTLVRSEAGGFLSYWQSWKIFAIQSAVSCLVYILFGYLLINVIDSDLGKEMNRSIKTKAIEQIEKYSAYMDEEAKEKTLESIQNQDYTGFSTTLTNFVVMLVVCVILSFILAAFLKKKDPTAELNG